jgi:hypothetical protein
MNCSGDFKMASAVATSTGVPKSSAPSGSKFFTDIVAHLTWFITIEIFPA